MAGNKALIKRVLTEPYAASFRKELAAELTRLQDERERLLEFANWIESWTHNPVGSYSVAALDGLFGMTRDRLVALSDVRTRS